MGRFLSVDPLAKSYPMLTPYQFASNRPIDGIDLDGLEYLDADIQFLSDINGPFLTHPNEDDTYTIILPGLTINNATMAQVGATQYFNIGQHIYFNGSSYSFDGRRSEQLTHNTLVGIQLITNIDNLPDMPEGVYTPNYATTDPNEIALSQEQANMYANCGGVCYAVSESRANQAYIDLYGEGIVNLTVSDTNVDHRVAATVGTTDPNMGYGAGGPFANNGYGNTVDNIGAWAGELQEGAVLQIWHSTDENDLFSRGGHSQIFREYIFDNNGNITGLQVTDNSSGIETLHRDYYEFNETILGVNLLDFQNE